MTLPPLTHPERRFPAAYSGQWRRFGGDGRQADYQKKIPAGIRPDDRDPKPG
jgi:hypothetical protein